MLSFVRHCIIRLLYFHNHTLSIPIMLPLIAYLKNITPGRQMVLGKNVLLCHNRLSINANSALLFKAGFTLRVCLSNI